MFNATGTYLDMCGVFSRNGAKGDFGLFGLFLSSCLYYMVGLFVCLVGCLAIWLFVSLLACLVGLLDDLLVDWLAA